MRRTPARIAILAAFAASVTSVALAQRSDAGVGGPEAPMQRDAASEPLDAAPEPFDAPEPTRDAGPPVPAPTAERAPSTDPPALEPSADAETIGALPPGVAPITWAPPARHCHRHRGRRFCDGPRRVPEPSEATRARQQTLGLDHPRAGSTALSAPLPAWSSAVPGTTTPGDLLWPVDGGRLWRGYGMHQRLARTKSGQVRRVRGRRRHEGVDIGAEVGTVIRAVNDGLVAYSDNGMRGYGNVIVLVHRDGSTSLYAHCSATYVAAGELVQRGQPIGAIGATGLAHGPHLHFEWRVGGNTRDPLRRFVERPSVTAASEEVPDEPHSDDPS